LTNTISNPLLFWGILAALFSCKGQHIQQASNTPNPQNATITKGDTVAELDKSIWIIFQDQNNNYWFGSDGQGIYRYNNKVITHFTTKNGLCNNQVRSIQEDNSGNIFFTTLDGISKFDGKTFTTLKVIIPAPPGDPWKSGPDDLWFPGNYAEKGPYRFDGKYLHQLKFPRHVLEDEFRSRSPGSTLNPYAVYTVYKDRRGNVWFGTAAFGLCRFDTAEKSLSWMYEKHLTDVPNGGSFGIRSILEDKEGKFWICNNRYRYDFYQPVATRYRDSQGYRLLNYSKKTGIDLPSEQASFNYYMSIIEDNDGALWLTTYSDGVWKYQNGNMTQYRLTDGVKTITVFSMHKDRKGNLWLGTHENGAYKFNGNSFEKFIVPN
jgi:ligand-binding sensor domain-containing protein